MNLKNLIVFKFNLINRNNFFINNHHFHSITRICNNHLNILNSNRTNVTDKLSCSLATAKTTAISIANTTTATHLFKNFNLNQNRNFCSKKTFDYLDDELKKLSVYQRYKKMAKEYWYVLFPVHCVCSIIIFGLCYLFTKSGVDTTAILEKAEKIGIPVEKLKNSKLGDLAVAVIFYKLVTPGRYMATVAATVWTIKFSVRKGFLKPMPSRERIKSIIQKKLEK